MNIAEFNEIIEPNDQTEARETHLEKLRELVGNVYPNKFDRTKITGKEDTITNVLAFQPIAEIVAEIKAHIATLNQGERPNPELKERLNAKLRELGNVRVSGRLAVPPRVMGKAAFVHLSDGVNRLQIYCRREDFVLVKSQESRVEGNENSRLSTLDSWTAFSFLDHGDFIGVEGYLFLTNTGELSVHVETLQFLAKAMLPMPDKMHGIADPELQRRYRYADLIASSLQIEHEGLTTREVFERRARLISGMRRYLDDAGYIEVETPMLTPKATGAAAKPFETHHNALDIPLYARIAPELYLKRLTVGGFEKVYELNRNFRNEGLSQRHNPEFTMLEFYCAYMDVNGMMDFAEAMIQESVKKATGSLVVEYDGKEIDFGKFERLTMKDAIQNQFGIIVEKLPSNAIREFPNDWIEDKSLVCSISTYLNIYNSGESQRKEPYRRTNPETLEDEIKLFHPKNDRQKIITEGWYEELPFQYVHNERVSESDWEGSKRENESPSDKQYTKAIIQLFEREVEDKIINPTFIIDYPKSISPLSKASPANPNIAERFELFINGMECANGFSELNDPREQYQRFVDQMTEREKGDDEAMVLDEDYIRALAYGMPPAAGIGIGIDRLVMLLTNKHSIRDVILFPHMKPKDEGGRMKDESETE